MAVALADFSREDRERGLDLLQAAEAVFVEIRAPSRLGTAVLSVNLSALDIEQDGPVYGPSLGACLMGYACRMSQSDPSLPDNEVARVERQLLRDSAGALDYDALADSPKNLEGLCEYVAEVDHTRFLRLLSQSPEAWQVFNIVAAEQLNRNLVRNGVSRRLRPPAEAIETFLFLGYLVRFIDEIAGEAPLHPSALAQS